MFVDTNQSITIQNTLIDSNYPSLGSTAYSINLGLVRVRSPATTTIINCTVTNNGSSTIPSNHRFGGGLFNSADSSGGTLLVEDGLYKDNRNAIVFNGYWSSTTLRSVNNTLTFSDMFNSTVLDNSTFAGNLTSIGMNGNPIVISNMNGSSINGQLFGSSGFIIGSRTVSIANCEFRDSDGLTSNCYNKALYISGASTALTIDNCIFTNLRSQGPQLYITGASSRSIIHKMTNCTFDMCENTMVSTTVN
jgi:hypothetical protein